MELQKAIQERRSIRKYDPEKKVTREQLIELAQAGILAPSWRNFQPARYYFVVSEEKLAKFKAEALPSFNAKNCADAPVLLVAAYKTGLSGFERTGEQTNELGDYWGAYDLGLACQNLMLKAKEMGLGTLVMGIRDADKIREILSIPEDEIIVSVISIGYPAQDPAAKPRKEAEEVSIFL